MEEEAEGAIQRLTTYEKKLAQFQAVRERKKQPRPARNLYPRYRRAELLRVLEDLIAETPHSLKQAECFISKYLKTNQISNVPENGQPGTHLTSTR